MKGLPRFISVTNPNTIDWFRKRFQNDEKNVLCPTVNLQLKILSAQKWCPVRGRNKTHWWSWYCPLSFFLKIYNRKDTIPQNTFLLTYSYDYWIRTNISPPFNKEAIFSLLNKCSYCELLRWPSRNCKAFVNVSINW